VTIAQSYRSLWTLICTALLTTGCALSPRSDFGSTLESIDTQSGYRASSILLRRPDDGMLVILSFSGGGMRASVMAYGVLEQLAQEMLPSHPHTANPAKGLHAKSLIETVDVISAVSGGAVPAAYYVLYGDQMFEDFADRYLYRDINSALRKRLLLSPQNWWRLTDKHFSRSDILAEFFDSKLFGNARYQDLDQSGKRPFLIVNATDIGAATRFEFTQDEFDRVCLNLGDWSISRAVTASSAVPALITPVTLRSRAGECGYHLPAWVQEVVSSSDHSSPRYQLAVSRMLRADPNRYRHLHLVDGALSDNLGVGAILDALLDPEAGRMRQDMPQKLVVLMVNAGDSQAERIGSNAEPPGFFDMLRLMGTVPVDRYTAASKAALREQLSNRLGHDRIDSLYFIEVELSSLLGHPEWSYLATLPTSFTIERSQVDALREATGYLLRGSPEYRRWLDDIQASSPMPGISCTTR
jgi:NTE family protein